MNALVPERAIVPSASAELASLMPMPLSSIVSRRAVGIEGYGDMRLAVVAEQAGVAQPS